ncbi:SRPBCC domain-containing protein [Lentzea alba]|uniref:SRPBCC family protein n=1 Tax=Lentzea alba TaxID=2714351 RepID=UPI0039BFABBF
MSTGIVRVRTKATEERVYQALTSGAELEVWLSERAHVNLAQGEFEFWGRYTPEGERGRQKLLGVSESSVQFSWFLHGKDYTVELGVEKRGDETVIAVTQSPYPAWGEGPTDEMRAGVVQTFWPLVLANLVEHVEGRPVFGFCDFTTPVQRFETDIAAPAASIMTALLDVDVFARWFGARIELEPEVGGRWSMGTFAEDPNPAKIVALDDSRFAIEFPDGMLSSWELAESDGKTHLTFVQSGFDATEPPYGSWMGWLSGFADMKRMLELSEWRPMWHSFEIPGLPDGVLVLE